MPRKRAHARQQVCIEAKILSPDLATCINGLLTDVSQGGALVSVRQDAEVSGRVYLWQARTEASVECEVRWRKLNLIGLKFVEQDSEELRDLLEACVPLQYAGAFRGVA